jgi:hypothetical protein
METIVVGHDGTDHVERARAWAGESSGRPGNRPGAEAEQEVRTLATEQSYAMFGLAEHELRSELEDELVRAVPAEGEAPTIPAIAQSVARILEQDHQRMAAQLERAGVHVNQQE